MRAAQLLGPLCLLTACTAPPKEVADALAQAVQARDIPAAMRLIHADYADPRGARAQLERDLLDLGAHFERARVDFEDLSTVTGVSAQEATVTGRLDAELIGDTTWRVVGPVQLDVVREDGFQVRCCLLPHLRGVRDLMARRRAALENNDADALRPLLHPNYRDGDRDADEVIGRLREDLEGVQIRMRVTNYRLEVRGPVAHLDEHYVLTVAGRTLPPQIGRFTLERSAGLWMIRSGLSSGTGSESP